ncbi:hypothetical protein C1646_774541 [Rhizophagus diaphanus]|nr:hypothetical protein C1646_774541 [Rhizophagus diaphanus] [Rhizophagus sp. MUCL 43196]
MRNNNNWEEDEMANLSNIFLKIGINTNNNHDKLRLLKSENNLLKKQIKELNEKRIKKKVSGKAANSSERKGILEAIIDGMKGGANANVYKSFIELELYYQHYKIKYGESGGKKLANDDIHSVIKTTKKSSNKCDIAPTYWESIIDPTWYKILEDLNLTQQANDISENEKEVFVITNKLNIFL